MPKPVTIFDPVVRLKADMSDPDISELQIPPHFTNIQHALQLGPAVPGDPGHAEPADHAHHRRPADGPLRGEHALPALPARPADGGGDACARRMLCAREGITINIFLLQSWNQSEEDVRFAYRHGRIDEGPRVLHRRPRPRPLRRLGLREAEEVDRVVKHPHGTGLPSCAASTQHNDRNRYA